MFTTLLKVVTHATLLVMLVVVQLLYPYIYLSIILYHNDWRVEVIALAFVAF